MTYKILTYSGSTCHNYVYFAFRGDSFDIDIITAALKLEPTSVMIKGDPVPTSTAWKYKIDAGSDPNLEMCLNILLDALEPKIDDINRLKQNLDLTTTLDLVMDIDIDPEVSTPYFPFSQRLINFLYLTATTVDFDLYKADTLNILNS